MNTTFMHQTVLLQEAVDALAIIPDGIYIDGTFGRGGHSREILQRLGPQGRLIALDRDPQAIAAAQALSRDSRFHIEQVAFSELAGCCERLGLKGKVSGILLDIGVSSPQLDDASRGFSFLRDGPLDMRMDTSSGLTAAQWLAGVAENELADIIKSYGEEKFGKRIAHAIVTHRQHTPIVSTHQLAAIIDEAVPVKDKFKHPATRTFQAIRIFINGELEQLQQALTGAVEVLATDGRLAVISFHSLEDRMVKRFMRDGSSGIKAPVNLPLTQQQIAATQTLRLIGKAIKPSAGEQANNSRARSAVMRVAAKK